MGMISVAALGVMIPIVAIVLGIGVAFWAIYWGHQTKRLQYEERRHMIEKGMVPPEILPEDDEDKPATPEQSLRSGIIMTFLGIGLGLGYFVLRNSFDDVPPWTLGVASAIVGSIGIGNLVYFFLRKDHPPS
jgi:nitrogen fixation-related uncharacterized protein